MSDLALTVVAGEPGGGKSTLVARLVQKYGLHHVDTDECWKRLFSKPSYTPLESNYVFEAVLQEVSSLLARGNSTITDGSFASYSRIERLRSLAKRYSAMFRVIQITCNFECASMRMRKRAILMETPEMPAELWHQLSIKLRNWPKAKDVKCIDSTSVNANEIEAQAEAFLSLTQ